MDRFACLFIRDLPFAAVLRAEPELAGKPVAITEPRDRKGRAAQSPTIIAEFLRGLRIGRIRASLPPHFR